MTVDDFFRRLQDDNQRVRGTHQLNGELYDGHLDEFRKRHRKLKLPRDLLALLRRNDGFCIGPTPDSPDGLLRFLPLCEMTDCEETRQLSLHLIVEEFPPTGLLLSRDSNGEGYIVLLTDTGRYIYLSASGDQTEIGCDIHQLLDYICKTWVDDLLQPAPAPSGLWRTGGTADQTRLSAQADGTIVSVAAVGTDLLFATDERGLGRVMCIDPAGQVTEQASSSGSILTDLTPFNGRLLEFQVMREESRLYIRDLQRNSSSDFLLQIIETHQRPASHSVTVCGNLAYFLAYPASGYQELWRTDGTFAGTWMVRAFHDAHVTHLAAAGDTLYFAVAPKQWSNDVAISFRGRGQGTTDR